MATASCFVLLVACAQQPDGPSPEALASASAAAEQEREDEERETDRRARRRDEFEACRDETRRPLRRLEELNSRLLVGLNYNDPASYLGDVRVAYDRIDTYEVGASCRSGVIDPLEDGYNAHVRALRRWRRCINDYYCELSDIRKALRRRWSRAEELAEQAREHLDQQDGITSAG
jgi:hypothetical protein